MFCLPVSTPELKPIILPVVLHECKTWFLTLREEHKLKVFENKVLKRISGFKKEEVAGVWRRLHNEELQNLYASPYIIRVTKSKTMRFSGHVARMRKMRNSNNILVGKHDQKRTLLRPRRRWEDNIRTNLREKVWERCGMDSSGSG
jgi:hypothetical protein